MSRRDEIISRINACTNELQQHDYTARKVAFEAARILKKLHPEEEMPYFDKYIEGELVAEERRKEIDELTEELETLEESSE